MRIVILFLMLMSASMNAFAGCTEKFSWLPNDESGVLGYRIYYGNTNLGPYPMVEEIYNPVPQNGRIYASIPDLECGIMYHFVCIAYNEYGESQYSIQVSNIAGERPFKWSLFMPAIINGRND